jgi:hypothetical protein
MPPVENALGESFSAEEEREEQKKRVESAGTRRTALFY